MSMQRQLDGSVRRSAEPAFIPPHRGVLQRTCACGGPSSGGGECAKCAGEEEAGRVRRQPAAPSVAPAGARGGATAPAVVHEALRSPGSALDGSTRAFFESRFDRDFSGVRVHTDETSARSARAVNALAYTIGNNVVFAKDQYSPHTASGRRLLAHELTHVSQQAGATASNLTLGEPHDASEREADRAAESILRSDAQVRNLGGQVRRQTVPGTVQRTPAPPDYHGVTGVRDMTQLHIDAIADFLKADLTAPRTINAHVVHPDVKHLTWMLYDPNDVMLAGFSTLPGRASSTTMPFQLKPSHFAGAGFVAGKHILRCVGLNARHEPVVYADRDFNVLTSDLTTGTALPTTHGDLKFTQYEKTDASPPATPNYQIRVKLSFLPKTTVACTDVTFIQNMRTIDAQGRSQMNTVNAEQDARKTPLGWSIDQLAGIPSPYYIANRSATGGAVDDPQFGVRGQGGTSPSAATLSDKPAWNKANVATFETCAICRSGASTGQVYGCATWGYTATAAGAVTLMPRSFRQMPSDQFEEARVAWNTWRATRPAATRPLAAPALTSP